MDTKRENINKIAVHLALRQSKRRPLEFLAHPDSTLKF